MAGDLGEGNRKRLFFVPAQVDRHANPGNSEATILLALLLQGEDRPDDALAYLNTIGADDLLAGEALDLQTRLLTDRGQGDLALERAKQAAASGTAGVQDFARLGNVLGDLERHVDAAAAYGEAISLSKGQDTEALWSLHLLRAASLEQADRWPDAKVELQQALTLEPNNPLLLNFLGYGKLERGEDLESAEAMIRKASELRPEDASITDSLGWALYKRGQLGEAVETLTRAAAGDPAQSEIHEHLGDALYSAGRRIEARFSWQAAMVTAQDKAKVRIEQKLQTGLTPATSAP
jgi:Flp pilus assembly protein TadD